MPPLPSAAASRLQNTAPALRWRRVCSTARKKPAMRPAKRGAERCTQRSTYVIILINYPVPIRAKRRQGLSEANMQCRTYPLNELESYKFVVVLSRCGGKIMLSRRRGRKTWETQGGHIEAGETPIGAARRELYEESGAVKYRIAPAFDYRAGDETSEANGMVFTAEIEELAALPASEMAEIAFFDALPENLTYPDITPVLFQRAEELF